MTNNFVLLGDSLTFGYGVKKNESWAFKIKDYTDLNVINKGINGDTTPSMLDRFYDDVSKNNPNIIFIMGGTNDLLMGHSVHTIIDNIKELINDSKKLTPNIYIGIPPYIIKEMANKLFIPSPFYPNCEENLPILRSKLIDLCNNESIQYIDLYTITKDNSLNEIYTDGIHFNSKGQKILLNEILNVISF